jgi:hypothetical protein
MKEFSVTELTKNEICNVNGGLCLCIRGNLMAIPSEDMDSEFNDDTDDDVVKSPNECKRVCSRYKFIEDGGEFGADGIMWVSGGKRYSYKISSIVTDKFDL